MSEHDFDIPKGLSRQGRKAAAILKRIARRRWANADGGGCRAFYTPTEWIKERGEEYGHGAELIVVYDGGGMRPLFEVSHFGPGAWDLVEEVRLALKEIGLWYEHCTCWYSAIYRIDKF